MKSSRVRVAVIASSAAALLALSYDPLMHAIKDPDAIDVIAASETVPVLSDGDAADDPALFVNSEAPERSLILGTDKDDGLAVYDLSGALLQYIDTGKFNNVDVRSGVLVGATEVALAAACETREEEVALFRIDADAQQVEELPPRFSLDFDPSGLCLHLDAQRRLFVFVSGFIPDREDEDWLQQWHVSTDATGTLSPRLVRSIRMRSGCEGMVADDRDGRLFVAEEHEGIWVFDAAPDGAPEGRLLHRTAPDGPLFQDVEGLALVDGPNGGYLIASSQGSDDFVVFERTGDSRYLGRFEIRSGRGVDAVSHTDGIDATSASLGSLFPGGLFVAQDDDNGWSNQNFKLVSWTDIRVAVGLP